jgi:mRNA-degrading endonuclease RelE of RelBE toxin-antitoxin system
MCSSLIGSELLLFRGTQSTKQGPEETKPRSVVRTLSTAVFIWFNFCGPYHESMSTAVMIQDSFLASAYELPKEITKKVFKALRTLLRDPRGGGLRIEKLSGRAAHLWSARVDDDYRIIFEWSKSGVPVVVYVAKHDDAYDFAEGGAKVTFGFASLAASPVGVSVGSLLELVAPVAIGRAIAGIAGLPNQPTRVSTEIDELEPLVDTRKYLPLARLLLNSTANRVEVPFAEIERIIGLQLPASARRYSAWWANESSGSHVQAHAWIGVGWRVETLVLQSETVAFRRS